MIPNTKEAGIYEELQGWQEGCFRYHASDFTIGIYPDNARLDATVIDADGYPIYEEGEMKAEERLKNDNN